VSISASAEGTSKGRARALLDRALELVPTRWGALVLFAVAFGVFWLEALAWPLAKGRDLWDYLSYYLELFHGHTVFPQMMAFRTPVTPVVLGVPLSVGGATALEIVLGVMFAVSVVAWAAAALTFGRWAAVLAAALVLAYPGYATLFHEASSDPVSATGFALWSLLVVRVVTRPTTFGFAAVGVGAAALALTRPANQILLFGVLLPLAASGRWRSRITWAAAFVAAALIPLGAWVLHNGIRFNSYSISRGRDQFVPFYDQFVTGRVAATNGPASERLARLAERDVLTLPAYRAARESVSTYFAAPSNYEAVRMFGLADKAFGLSGGPAFLHEVGVEALDHGHTPTGAKGHGGGTSGYFLSAPIHGVWRLLDFAIGPAPGTKQPAVYPAPGPTTTTNGRVVPNPAALGPNLLAIGYGFFWCAADDINLCILRDPSTAYANPATQRRYVDVVTKVRAWNAELSDRNGSRFVAAQLWRATYHFPRGWMFLVVGGIALAWRRPRNLRVIVVVPLLALLVLAIHALVTGPDPAYGLPVYPALFVFASAALVGDRRPT
jgi:hypothetical protein